MVEAQKGLLEFLEQLRKERDELEVLIKGVEKRLGIASDSDSLDTPVTGTPRVTVSIDSIPVGFFHNLRQSAAAEKLLRLNRSHALTTKEIVDVLRKSGMDLRSKNAITIMYNTLKRSTKFERVAGKAWGMSEWYPEKKRRAEEREDEEQQVKDQE